MNYVSLLIFVAVILALFAFTARARRRQAAAQAEISERIVVGTEVMTTSGLHGTVVAKDPDGTVALSIAPGVEVRWELAALRDVTALPDRYRRAAEAGQDQPADGVAGEAPGSAAPAGDDAAPQIDLHKDA